MNYGDEDKDVSDQQGDLEINNLVYRQPLALSLATNRNYKRQFFQRNTYSNGDTMIIDLNSGQDHINLANCYMTFVMTLTGGTAPNASFGVGSVINIFNILTARSKSGVEVDRVEQLNLLSAKTLRYEKSYQWIANYGQMLGMAPADPITGVIPTTGVFTSQARKFVVPLSLLSGFFNPDGNKLLPPQVAGGLHLEFILDTPTKALIATGTPTGYTLTECAIMLDTTTLSDMTQKSLNQDSAQSGLEYSYYRWYTSPNNIGTSLSVVVQARKAVAQAEVVISSIVNDTPLITTDSFASLAWDVSSHQYRLGSIYFPSNTYSAETDGLEPYMATQSTFNKNLHFDRESSVSLVAFQTQGMGVMAQSLEKDQALVLSGAPVNNSRVLELNALRTGATSSNVVVFLKYASVAKIFLDNIAVSI